MVCPAYALVSKVTCVHAVPVGQTFNAVARVVPDVLRICAWIWSYVSVSVQCGWYQNVRRELPLGIATDCASVLFPFTAVVDPICAEEPPLCAVLLIRGRKAPLAVQPLSVPVSKPPLTMPCAAAVTVRLTVVVCVVVVPVPVTVIVL